ncbi:helix-turn-helix domain-containing protein [Brevibacillus sp. NPDC058079]|uniref:helix-turn-helix domain-containing protein n=1 Tax=Brevibacillus sp. NPDC058079 TaxID=3346330 RepID=UPI0036E6EA73
MTVDNKEIIDRDQQDDIYEMYKPDMVEFGKWVHEKRMEKGWSLELLARKSKVEKSYIHRLERGDRANPGFIVVYRLAKVFGRSLDDIIRED